MSERKLSTTEERAFFLRHGFVSIPRPVVPPDELAIAGSLLESVMGLFETLPPNLRHELASGRANARIHEVPYVAKLVPELRETRVFSALEQVAKELLDCDHVRLHFDHMIVKPAGSTAPTSWHQDVAFDPDYDCPMATVWLPFRAVDERNGCMRYISVEDCGEVLDHSAVGVDAKGVTVLPEHRIVDVPLPAGGVAVHGARTLHGAGPNLSAQERTAWIVKFVEDFRNPVRARAATAAHQRYWRSILKRPLEERFDIDFSAEY